MVAGRGDDAAAQLSDDATIRIGAGRAVDAEELADRLRQVPGVAEVVVIAGEELAYLKVDLSLRRSVGAMARCCDVMRLGVPLIMPLKSNRRTRREM
jgi:hypothetical protein